MDRDLIGLAMPIPRQRQHRCLWNRGGVSLVSGLKALDPSLQKLFSASIDSILNITYSDWLRVAALHRGSVCASHPAAPGSKTSSAKVFFCHYWLIRGKYWDWTHLVFKQIQLAAKAWSWSILIDSKRSRFTWRDVWQPIIMFKLQDWKNWGWKYFCWIGSRP